MQTEECRQYLNIWLHHLEKSTGDAESVPAALRHVTTCASCRDHLRRLAQAVAGSVEDQLTCDECQAQLPEFVHAQTTGAVDEQFDAVRGHLALCPHCADAYDQISELVRASRADAVPVADSYPEFDLSTATATSLTGDVVQDALDRGRQWVRDAAGALYVLFGPGLQTRPTPAWATKSAQPGTLLYQVTLGAEETAGWEVEVLVFAEDDETCNIEVALYRPGANDTDLVQIPIALRYGDVVRTRTTDAGGVAEFDRVPTTSLEDVVIRVEPGID